MCKKSSSPVCACTLHFLTFSFLLINWTAKPQVKRYFEVAPTHRLRTAMAPSTDSTASVNLDFDFGRYVVSNRLSLLRPQSIPQFIIHDEMTWWVYMTRGGGGVINSSMAPIGIARRMILAIVTSRDDLSTLNGSSSEIVSWFQEVKVETLRWNDRRYVFIY